jgi:hypothetical protein
LQGNVFEDALVSAGAFGYVVIEAYSACR